MKEELVIKELRFGTTEDIWTGTLLGLQNRVHPQSRCWSEVNNDDPVTPRDR